MFLFVCLFVFFVFTVLGFPAILLGDRLGDFLSHLQSYVLIIFGTVQMVFQFYNRLYPASASQKENDVTAG